MNKSTNPLSPDAIKAGKYEVSSHFIEQATKRGISMELVEKAIKTGYRQNGAETHTGTSIAYTLGAFRVFFSKHPQKNIANLLTTYWADDYTGLVGGYQPKCPLECERLMKLKVKM